MNNETSNELTSAVSAISLEEQTAKLLKEKFMPFYLQAQEWAVKANGLTVTDETQVELMQQAREARLCLKKIRVECDKVREELKADSLRYAKAVQTTYNVIENLIKPIEIHLQTQEDFVKIENAKKQELVRQERMKQLEPYTDYFPAGFDIGILEEVAFNSLLEGAKLQKERREKEIKEEAERVEAKRLADLQKANMEKERLREVGKYYPVLGNGSDWLISLPEEAYIAEKAKLEVRLEAFNKERERLLKESEIKEAQEREQKVIREQRFQKLRPYLMFIPSVEKLMEIPASEFESKLKVLEIEKKEYEEKLAEQKKKDEEALELVRKTEEAMNLKDKDKFLFFISELIALGTKYDFKSPKFSKLYKEAQINLSSVVTNLKNKV